jgi:hypothetical protein
MRRSHKQALYVSRRSAKNLWQRYRVYSDRIELQFWFAFHTLVIPLRVIEDIQVRRASALPDRGLGDPLWFRIVKLDWADFFTHVSLHKGSGFVRCYWFTPDDPDAFVAAVQTVLNQ